MRFFAFAYVATVFVSQVLASPLADVTALSSKEIYDLASRDVEADCGAVGTAKCCAGTAQSTAAKDQVYLCGDSRLGPKTLPTTPPIGPMLASWQRTAGLCPGEFLKKWYKEQDKTWWWPQNDGFVVDSKGKPITTKATLAVGTRLDRFGSENGNFFAPAGVLYSKRAIPPSNLNTFDAKIPNNYYVYEVVKPFDALSGDILPWFGQAGLGKQYKTNDKAIDLVTKGFLKRV